MAGAADVAEGEAGEFMSRLEWQLELAGGFQRMEGALLEKITALIALLTRSKGHLVYHLTRSKYFKTSHLKLWRLEGN